MRTLRAATWLVAGLLVASCSEGAGSDAVPNAATPSDAPAESALGGAQMPQPPTWAVGAIGKNIAELYPVSETLPETCVGFVDGLTEYFAEDAGARYEGWAWSTSQAKPYPHLLATDANGVVQGAGETSIERPDVPAAVPAITTSRVGFVGAASVAKGVVRFYGINEETGSSCLIGEFKS